MKTSIIKFLALALALPTLPTFATTQYQDSHVRLTMIDEATVRLEYSPGGEFVDNKSFVASQRNYPDVENCTISETNTHVTITTPCLVLSYKKGEAPLSAENLKIESGAEVSPAFVWTPGMQQKENLKGTYRTLDGYNGEFNRHDNGTPMPIEDGLLARDGWTLIDDSQGLLFDNDKDWEWVTKRETAPESQDWYFMAYGDDYRGALKSFTRFAGKMPMPPRYAFGYWWSRYWSYSDRDFRDLLEMFDEQGIPLDVLVIDMDWHPISEDAGGGWTGWDWNERLFPDYRQFLAHLEKHGVKTTMNLHPADGVRPYEKKYAEFTQKAGRQPGEAHEWLGSDKNYIKAIFDTYLHPYMEEGVDFWWIDWQQWLADKQMPELSNTWWCNYLFFSDMERTATKRPMLYHRWGGLGNHRYQIGFSGDSYITWESLAFLPYFNSTASNVLYGYWSHDIGGHQSTEWGTPVPAELYTRSMQMGQYLPILRTHSTKDPALNKEPWAFPHETQRRIKNTINMRYALVPYIYTMAREAYDEGISLCRPMYYDYPRALEAYDNKDQYMFGSHMMIAPVVSPVDESGFARRDVWLPEGEWIEFDSGTLLQGGNSYRRSFNMDEYPVYIKAGSILPYYGKLRNLSGTEQPVTLRIFPGAESGSFSIYEDNGEDAAYDTEFARTEVSYTARDKKIVVNLQPRNGAYKNMPQSREYSIALPMRKAPQSVTMNGMPLEFEYDGYALETLIPLGEIDCSTATEVEIAFADADNRLDNGLKGRFNRIRSAVADYKQADCGMVYTEDFGYLESAPLRMSYHPAEQSATIQRFNELYGRLDRVVKQQIEKEDLASRFISNLDEQH